MALRVGSARVAVVIWLIALVLYSISSLQAQI
jgi:hypothetical protein